MNSEARLLQILALKSFLIKNKIPFDTEVVFNKIMDTKRRFRADYLINNNIILEINGGQWTNGRHNRGGKGYENDLTKMNLSQENGFKYIQFTYEMLQRKEYEQTILNIIKGD